MKKIVALIVSMSILLMMLPCVNVALAAETGTITDDFSLDIASNTHIAEYSGLQYNSWEKGYRAEYKSGAVGSDGKVLPYMVVQAPINTGITELRFVGKIAYWNTTIADFKFEQLSSNGQYTEITPEITVGEKSGNFTPKTYTITADNAKRVRITMPEKYGENYNAYMVSVEYDWSANTWSDITEGECDYTCTIKPAQAEYTQNHTNLVLANNKAWRRSGDGITEAYFVIKAPVNAVITSVTANCTVDGNFTSSKEFSFYQSDNSVDYTVLTAESDTPVASGNSYSKNYTISDLAGAKFIKIQFPTGITNAWQSELNSFSFTWRTGEAEVVPVPIEYSASADIQVGNIVVKDNFESLAGAITANLTVTSTDPENVYAKAYMAVYDDDALSAIVSKDIVVKQGSNPYTLDGITKVKDVGDEIKIYVWTGTTPLVIPVCKTQTDEPIVEGESLKVLAIGNSFSVDGMEYLYQLAQDAGIENVVLGNLYIGGCTLEQHWNKANNNTASYIYYKNTDGTWTETESQTMKYGLQDEEWDVITLQQSSDKSGVASSYNPYVENLVEYINANKINENAKLAWHMTWAYQQDSTHSGFANYDNSQATMYNAIVSAVQNEILSTNAFDFVIPAGTAIQNVRTSYIGDTLTRDGYHLSYKMGRYTAGLTWLKAITGESVDDITYLPPSSGMEDEDVEVIKEAVNAACSTPYAVTESTHKEKGQIDFNNYTLLEWTPSVASYWHSVQSFNLYSNNSSYLATPQFTKADLPDGTLIVVDEGYQYRPEGWVDSTTLNASSDRPANVTENITVVGPTWWGNFNYRAFNIAKKGASSSITEEEASHFRIYIPKSN